MANSFKRAYGYAAMLGKGTPCAPITKHYIVTVDTAAALDLEADISGYFIPVGGVAVTGDMTGTSPTVKLTAGATDLMVAADPGTGILFSTTSGGVLPGEATTKKLILTAAGTSPVGTLSVAVTLVPLAAATYQAGAGA